MESKTIFQSKPAQKEGGESPIILRQSMSIFIFKIILVELFSILIYVVVKIPEIYLHIQSQFEIELIPYYFLTFLIIGLFRILIILLITLRWITTQYIITTGEIIFRKGIINVTEREFSIAHVQEISCQQSFIGRLFNFGTIEIYSPSIRERMFFSQIPDPKKYEGVISSYLTGSKEVSYTPSGSE